ncbi:enoyl-CoA hydratase/isomerase family protein [Mycoplana rhizolycopersici]|uniref:Enoyl-CoA hydratase/isomerase family protein n=1 Tax=Mycoplana rhizolycopersici TaxID=2746702 RepID=A0ABX2QIV6_9HYPH|nr:enoyl-CoA hydratase-related protein [Rhizobium rhizolycopersici]NVP57630.1 enoyl-CoA hydratase/isomerase family protein [Rhizobium rhizolycopersici]
MKVPPQETFGRESEVLLDWANERVVQVTINRQHKRNACNQQAWQGIHNALRRAAQDKAIRLAVLTGASGHFSAGDDIKDASAAREDPHRRTAYEQDIEHAFRAVTEAPFPVVAAIDGYCIGGALSLAMCCDFRVGTRASELGIPAAKLSFTYPSWQCSRLMTLVGLSQARKMLFEGNRIDGNRAYETGLLDVLTDEDPVAAALDFCSGMLDSAPLSVQASKRIFQALAVTDLASHQDEIAAFMRMVAASSDFREGARAFAEKRKPIFTGT